MYTSTEYKEEERRHCCDVVSDDRGAKKIIVFMYGCGSQLAQQLLEVGVVALDGRCLDLERVEKHLKKWCSDACGNILF